MISKTKFELKGIAQEATSDYIQNNTPLTQAVIKAASAHQPLTNEHVKRICEMTYHDTYARLYSEKTGSTQYVRFTPPEYIQVCEALDAQQVVSTKEASVSQEQFSYNAEFNKLASAHSIPKKHVKRNVFDMHMGVYQEDPAIKEAEVRAGNWAELQRLREATQTVDNDLNTARSLQKMAMYEYLEHARGAVSEGVPVADILDASLQAVDLSSPLTSKIASALIQQVSSSLVKKPLEKTASRQGRVNMNHPLPKGFAKIAHYATQVLIHNNAKVDLDRRYQSKKVEMYAS